MREMNKIRIITDSASDITAPLTENMSILPLSVFFGEEEYRDGVDLTHSEFYEKLIESDVLPTTSLVSPDDFMKVFEECRQAGETAIVVTISSKLSGTYNSARIAAEDFDNVYVVDSLNATVGERILVERAVELARTSAEPKEIAEILEAERLKIRLIGLLDTLEYLKKGGRISATTAFVGGVLNIKPCVTIEDGVIELLGKARGSKNGNNFLIKEIEKGNGIDFERPICLGYAGLSDVLINKYIEDSGHLWKNCTGSLNVHSIGATIGTHVGPGAIAVAFFEK